MSVGARPACVGRALSLALSVAVAGCVAAPDIAQTTEPLTYCPGPATLQGIDVSEYQGSIDWGAVARSGRSFAVARVADGDYVDPYFAGNWNGIRAAGMVRGVYQFFRPELDPVAQANILLAHVGGIGPGDLPPVLDVEVTDGVGPGGMNNAIHRWVDRIQSATGVAPMIYVGSYFWNDNVGTGDFAGLPLWLPAYGPTCPLLPNPWTRWRIHQYSSSGSVPGIAGRVDVDIFDGDQGALAALAGGGAPPPPPPPTCTPACSGTVIVNHDCSRNDCAAQGNFCTQAGGTPHCIAPDRGSLDSVGCGTITGWAQDPNAAGNAITVNLYTDGPSGTGAGPITVTAGTHRDDLCTAIGSCDHGFSLETPASLRDGQPHTVYAYAVGDTSAGEMAETLLGGSPKTVQCSVPQLADFNGDGRSDVVIYRSDWASVPVCLSLGTGWTCRNLPATDVDGWTGGNAGSGVLAGGFPLLGHFNGNPWTDLVQYDPAGGGVVPVCDSLVSGWTCRGLVPTYVGGGFGAAGDGTGLYAGGHGLLGDVNGDGLDDLVQYNSTWQSAPVCLSLGSGWSCRNLVATETDGAATGNSGSGIHAGATALLGDVNGDGRKDLVQYNAGGSTLPVCLSVGTGWSCRDLAATFTDVDRVAGNNLSGIFGGSTALVGDFNGDGLSDVIQYNPAADGIPVCVSLRTGWSCRNLPATYVGDPGSAGNNGSGVYPGGMALLGDVNGDGRIDLIQYNDGWSTIPVCLSLGTGWSCRNLPATYVGGDLPAGNGGSGVYVGGTPMVGDFNGDGRADVVQYQSQDWTGIPVCLSLGTGWSCRNLTASYDGGIGAGNGGLGVY